MVTRSLIALGLPCGASAERGSTFARWDANTMPLSAAPLAALGPIAISEGPITQHSRVVAGANRPLERAVGMANRAGPRAADDVIAVFGHQHQMGSSSRHRQRPPVR